MIQTRNYANTGRFPSWLVWETFGSTRLGTPLRVVDRTGGKSRGLLLVGGIHGEEPETTMVLSRMLRLLTDPIPGVAVVVCANPDGIAMGTRGNAAGVDLNRNFPTVNWRPDPVVHSQWLEAPRTVELSPGTSPASEPETKAMLDLVERLRPAAIVSFHAPLDCVDASASSRIGRELSDLLGLRLVDDIGYPTPGSLGTWCGEKGIDCVTVETPRAPAEILARDWSGLLVEWLLGRNTTEESL